MTIIFYIWKEDITRHLSDQALPIKADWNHFVLVIQLSSNTKNNLIKKMGLKITIKGDEQTPEYQDALALKKIFQEGLIKGDGEILIISSATLFGQDVKDIDLIAIGTLNNYSCSVKSRVKTKGMAYPEEIRKVYVRDFCFAIETKKHTLENVQLEGQQLLVKYNGKLKDATTQSENQKYSLTRFFEDRLKYKPYVCNFIWLRNISADSLKSLVGNNSASSNKHNFLPSQFNLTTLFALACVQNSPYQSTHSNGDFKGFPGFSCINYQTELDLNKISDAFELFTKIKKGIGDLTRKKVSRITSKLLAEQQYAKSIGEKLVIIAGRAGTGKTIKLLNIACNLYENENARCLILTYNHALVSDIKRTLALADISDNVDSQSVQIKTLHKFFYRILLGFGIGNIQESANNKRYLSEYLEKYDSLLADLLEYIESGLIDESDIQQLMKSDHDEVAWDYILIDEAQDWSEIEKKIIYKIFKPNKVIIADGVDQLIRGQKKCNWVHLMRNDEFQRTNEKRGLRQKVNLVHFVNELAKKLEINWSLEPKDELIGGNIIIRNQPYGIDLHSVVFESCKVNGNSAYEMMFLVPPSLVHKVSASDDYGNTYFHKQFLHLSEYENSGIKIWDGTNSDLRSEYVVNLDDHRLLQYESCRGLEGWTVVCLNFDDFIQYKMETFYEEDNGELALETFEDKRNRFVYLWALIPMTRAIDTLVITLRNPNSKIGQILKSISTENPDFVTWE